MCNHGPSFLHRRGQIELPLLRHLDGCLGLGHGDGDSRVPDGSRYLPQPKPKGYREEKRGAEKVVAGLLHGFIPLANPPRPADFSRTVKSE